MLEYWRRPRGVIAQFRPKETSHGPSTFRHRICRDRTCGRNRIRARAYPSRPITVINAFPPGGVNDIVTRPLAAALEPILKQPVVIDTKAGAAGQIGAQVAAFSQP